MRFISHVAAALSLSFAALAVPLAGCAPETPASPADESSELSSPLCKGAGCGPVICTIAVKCALGYHSVDTDGDGCNDSCEPDGCATAIKCAPGYHSVDTDGDGCNDSCEPDCGAHAS